MPTVAGVVESVDTGDLKSPGSNTVPVRVRSPAPPQFQYRGVEQLVARRAHNPEAVGSNPAPATFYGGLAQVVRACGSYPQCPGFNSLNRHFFTLLFNYLYQDLSFFKYTYSYLSFINLSYAEPKR